MTTIIFFISCIFSIIFYIKLFIIYPYYVAKRRNHNNVIPVLLISFVPIGFFISLAWAFSNDIDKNKKRDLTDKKIIIHGIKSFVFLIISCFVTGMSFVWGFTG